VSTQVKTVLLTILIVFLATGATFFSSWYFANARLEKNVENDLEFAIGIADSLISSQIDTMKNNAITVSGRLAQANSDDEIATLMTNYFQNRSDILGLTLFDQNGTIASSGELIREEDMGFKDADIERVYAGDTIISSPFFCDKNQTLVMSVCTPLGSGRILIVTFPYLPFSETLSKHRFWDTGFIYVVNENGSLIGSGDEDLAAAINDYTDGDVDDFDKDGETINGLIKTMLATEKGIEHYTFQGKEQLCVYSRVSGSHRGWRVAVSVPLSESPQAKGLNDQIYVAVLFSILGITAAFFLSRLTARPLKKVEAQKRILEDLNETIEAQALAIQTEHERAQAMLDATPLACRLWDRNFNLLACNEAAMRLFGVSDKANYLSRYYEFSPEYQPNGLSTRESVRMIVDEAFRTGRSSIEWVYQLQDGTLIPADLTLVRVPYENDFAVASYSRDLREKKTMLAEIDQRDSLLQIVNIVADTLLRSSVEDFEKTLTQCMGMMARAINAEIMHVSRNYIENGRLCCRQLYEWTENVQAFQDVDLTAGISYDESTPEVKSRLLHGENVHDRVSNLGPVDSAWLASQGISSILYVPIFLGDDFWGFVFFGNCDSEELFTENEARIMRSGSVLIADALMRSEHILNMQRTSDQLQDALIDAREANSAKSIFLAHMSHEMRTPLNAVVGLSELALEDGEVSSETGNKLEKIHASGVTILNIINDILDISKIESGKLEIHPNQYDAAKLINDVVMFNIARIEEKPIEFKLDVDPDLPKTLYGDELRVRQVFNNLLSNAFKYTDEGLVEWQISFEREGESVWLISEVRDTGRGIKPEDRKQLFTDYYQVTQETGHKIEGTGLGLSITKSIVEMMDGHVTVESEYGKGTLFSVRIRQGFVTDTSIDREALESSLANGTYLLPTIQRNDANLPYLDLSYAQVLVVDDILTNIDVAEGMLELYGVKVDCATSGGQAIEMIRAENPRYDAVFMDHMMPGMDGIEATRIIREEIGTDYAENIPIIALTANAIIGNEKMFLSKGFQAFISKPIDKARLDVVLRRWVRNEAKEKKMRAMGNK
jgi:signal transduction histidine kinase/CheY-like chemotaxis protein/PAS domain-containing protein